jgi:hypothetical protein
MAWEARHTQIWQLHTQGLSQRAIARAMAMPRTTVRDALRRLAKDPPATTRPADVWLNLAMSPESGSECPRGAQTPASTHAQGPVEPSCQPNLPDPPLAAEGRDQEGAVQPAPVQERQHLVGQLHSVLGHIRQLEERRMQHLEAQIQHAEEQTRRAAAVLWQALQQFQDAAAAQEQLVTEITAATRQTLQTTEQLLQTWPGETP